MYAGIVNLTKVINTDVFALALIQVNRNGSLNVQLCRDNGAPREIR